MSDDADKIDGNEDEDEDNEPSSKKKGLLMALFVIGGLAVAVGAIVGITTYVSKQNEKNKKEDGEDDNNSNNNTPDDDANDDDDDVITPDTDPVTPTNGATWVYYPGLTNSAKPITQIKGADVATLKKKCLSTAGAVMFNTDGWIYNYVGGWTMGPADATRGTYVLSTADPNLNAEHDGYTFFPCADSDGNDLVKRVDLSGNVPMLKKTTDNYGDQAAGFNTSGYIKKAPLTAQTKWRMFTTDVTKGLYVKDYQPQP